MSRRPYRIKECFLTLQGEGANTGRAALFVRFSGCNLWSGRAEDRARGKGGCARWCDTDFVGTDGAGGGTFDTPEALARHLVALWPSPAHRFVVLTGGEPLLQLDAPLIDALHAAGFELGVETNGTLPVPRGIDWCCVSPKQGAPCVVDEGDELKLVFPQEGLLPETFETGRFRHFFLQPLDGPGREEHLQTAIRYCLAHPRWRLSLQTHKLLGIP